MPVPATVPEFIEIVRKSGLVDDSRLQTELNKLASAQSEGIESVSNALIRAGLLTRFQSRQLKLGRYKRFMIANKYRLLELIGVGGMGAVYLCEHVFMRRLVALKVLPLEKLADPSNLERFYREARAVAALDHPNIVRAHDIDKAEGLHFLVMEYVDGASLQEIVARFGPIDPIRAANYIAQAAVGMQHGHDLGMVHRDIKPGNLLLDRTGVIKLLDMGLARFFHDKNDNLTAKYDDNCVLGTADYLAPEQALTNEVDIRADIYALGGTFYFLLTGQSPVPDGTVAYKLMFHQQEEPKPVSEYRSDVPEGMIEILHKMMRKKPTDRFDLPIDVAAALSEWASQPISTPPAAEMPDHCPAVVMAAGYSERGRVASPANRQSGLGRVVVPASSQSSSSHRYSMADFSPNPDTTMPSGQFSVRLEASRRQSDVPTARSSSTVPLNPPLPDKPVPAPDWSKEIKSLSPDAVLRGINRNGKAGQWLRIAAVGISLAILLIAGAYIAATRGYLNLP